MFFGGSTMLTFLLPTRWLNRFCIGFIPWGSLIRTRHDSRLPTNRWLKWSFPFGVALASWDTQLPSPPLARSPSSGAPRSSRSGSKGKALGRWGLSKGWGVDRAKHPQHLDILTYMLFKVLVGVWCYFIFSEISNLSIFYPFRLALVNKNVACPASGGNTTSPKEGGSPGRLKDTFLRWMLWEGKIHLKTMDSLNGNVIRCKIWAFFSSTLNWHISHIPS